MSTVHRYVGLTAGLLAIMWLSGCETPPGSSSPGTGPAAGAAPTTRPATAEAAAVAQPDQPAAAPAAAQPTTEVQQLIAGAEKLTFSSERAALLERIAVRDDLTTADQIALVDAACRLGFSDQITSVFLKLAANSSLTAESRSYLLDKLDCILFSGQRKEVLDALSETTPR